MLKSHRPSTIYDLVICIPDMHFPYQHPDLIKFLKAVRKRYDAYYRIRKKSVLTLFGGDEVEFAEISFHDSHPSLPKAEIELDMAVRGLKEVYKLFPEAIVLESNHGSLPVRRQISDQLPKQLFKTYNEYLEAPKTWQWVKDITFKVPRHTIYGCHGKVSDVTRMSKQMGMSAIQFHYHTKLKIEYWASTAGLNYAIQAGCVIDDESLSFTYNKLQLDRPLLAVIVIEAGVPRIHPLIVDEKNRWIGELL